MVRHDIARGDDLPRLPMRQLVAVSCVFVSKVEKVAQLLRGIPLALARNTVVRRFKKRQKEVAAEWLKYPEAHSNESSHKHVPAASAKPLTSARRMPVGRALKRSVLHRFQPLFPTGPVCCGIYGT